ncbi:MAG TPA: mechanosensitive ion channel [Acidobacteriota bacterium]|nr:mechanosensitive ion channel [Acidobacteriota bacterium]
MDTLIKLAEVIREMLNFPLIQFGKTPVTLWTLLYLGMLILALVTFSNWLKRWIVKRALARPSIHIGVREAFGSIIRYFTLVIGLMMIMQTAGIDLTSILTLAGALGIGIGLGLQNITNNFVSGLIILFERPIKVGDRIEVGNITGDVVAISPRATTVITNDNIAMIIPNSEFISSQVINWSYRDQRVRFNFKLPVSYAVKPEAVRKVLLEVAAEHPGVLKDRRSDVLIHEFGDSGIIYILRVWSSEYIGNPGVLRSELFYSVVRKFEEQGIVIPFPQRDIHIRSGAVELKAREELRMKNEE